MSKSAIEEYNDDYIRRIQAGRLELNILRAQLKQAVRDRDEALSGVREREKAMDATLDALVGSLRPFGLDHRKFARRIRSIARGIPDGGPQAAQHGVLFDLTNRILSSVGSRRGG